MKNILGISLILIVLVVGGWYALSGGIFTAENGDKTRVETEEGVVAIVNGEEIARADFEMVRERIAVQQGLDIETLDAEMREQVQNSALEDLVSRALLRQAAEAAGVTASAENVEEEFQGIAAQFQDEEEFRAALSTEGLTEEGLRSRLEQDILMQAYLEQTIDLESVTVSEEEIETYYNDSTAGSENIPPFEEVRGQIEQMVLQEKQSAMVSELIGTLRGEAVIEILI